MVLLVLGALCSNLFHRLISICVKEFCLLFFLVPNFLMFRSYLLIALILKHKGFAWINFINPPYNFYNFNWVTRSLFFSTENLLNFLCLST